MPDLIGHSLGRYHIIEQLGEGGMATVFKAHDTRLERDVAVKIIRRGAFPPEQVERVLKRFEREAKALASLTHPNIVGVIDYGEYEESPYLVMPFLPGGTLKGKLGKPMPWQEAVSLVLPISRALEYAHANGIIHRDVKPSNIILTARGEPMLTDFGIAKVLESNETHTLTGTGVGIGTPEYMAPEQWTGQAGMQSDIYSLGVVLYELVTGRKPFRADTPGAVLLKQATEPLPRPREFTPNLPEAVEKVLFKALAKEPEDRYRNMSEMAAALERLRESGLPVASPPGELAGAEKEGKPKKPAKRKILPVKDKVQKKEAAPADLPREGFTLDLIEKERNTLSEEIPAIPAERSRRRHGKSREARVNMVKPGWWKWAVGAGAGLVLIISLGILIRPLLNDSTAVFRPMQGPTLTATVSGEIMPVLTPSELATTNPTDTSVVRLVVNMNVRETIALDSSGNQETLAPIGGILSHAGDRLFDGKEFYDRVSGQVSTKVFDSYTAFQDLRQKIFWSPDDSQILISADKDRYQKNDVYFMNSDGTNLRRMDCLDAYGRDLGAVFNAVGWKDDGQNVIVAVQLIENRPETKSYSTNLFMVDTGCSQVTKLGYSSTYMQELAVSHDGEDIAWLDDYGLFIIHNGQPERQVLTYEIPDCTQAGCAIRWSYDDNAIIISVYSKDYGTGFSTEGGGIYLAQLSDGSVSQLLDYGSDAIQSPDGSEIAFFSGISGSPRLYVMDSNGTHVVLLPFEMGQYFLGKSMMDWRSIPYYP